MLPYILFINEIDFLRCYHGKLLNMSYVTYITPFDFI